MNIDPTAEHLAEIASLAADFAKQLDLPPRMAMLSFSNFGSVPHPMSEKVKKATELIKAKRPDLIVDGEMQADVAVNSAMMEERFPFSAVREANMWSSPICKSANIAYKLLHHLGNAQVIGPVLLGMGAPVHVLQAGDDVNE